MAFSPQKSRDPSAGETEGGGEADLHALRVGRTAMACTFEMIFNAGEHPEATDRAIEALDAVDAVEAILSVHREESEASRLNRMAAGGYCGVSGEMLEVLLRSRSLWERTGGGFDPATGALVRAWGFHRREGRLPGDAALQAARDSSGMHLVEIDPERRSVRFLREGVALTFAAIGKGWAVDRAVDRLREGIGEGLSVLVKGGASSVRAVGSQGSTTGRTGWRVGLVHPGRPTVRLGTFTLRDRSLATSGSQTQFFVDRGRRLGHLLDPRTGRPAEGVLSATVLAPEACDADALATAAYVRGPAALPDLAPRGGPVAAVMVLPGPAAGLRLFTANIDPGDFIVHPGLPGVTVLEST
jgi:thiamine biosynthesis lipoprotein